MSPDEKLAYKILKLALQILESGDKEKVEKLFTFLSGLQLDIAIEKG